MNGERRTVIYRGHVQGVGFRWQTERALAGVAVTGFVRNLSDGTVELVIEGTPAALEDALARVTDALGHLVHGQDVTTSDATGEFGDFGIRR